MLAKTRPIKSEKWGFRAEEKLSLKWLFLELAAIYRNCVNRSAKANMIHPQPISRANLVQLLCDSWTRSEKNISASTSQVWTNPSHSEAGSTICAQPEKKAASSILCIHITEKQKQLRREPQHRVSPSEREVLDIDWPHRFAFLCLRKAHSQLTRRARNCFPLKSSSCAIEFASWFTEHCLLVFVVGRGMLCFARSLVTCEVRWTKQSWSIFVSFVSTIDAQLCAGLFHHRTASFLPFFFRRHITTRAYRVPRPSVRVCWWICWPCAYRQKSSLPRVTSCRWDNDWWMNRREITRLRQCLRKFL